MCCFTLLAGTAAQCRGGSAEQGPGGCVALARALAAAACSAGAPLSLSLCVPSQKTCTRTSDPNLVSLCRAPCFLLWGYARHTVPLLERYRIAFFFPFHCGNSETPGTPLSMLSRDPWTIAAKDDAILVMLHTGTRSCRAGAAEGRRGTPQGGRDGSSR